MNRDPRRLYSAKRINLKLQKAREQMSQTTLNHQEIKHTFQKLKNLLEEMAEGDEENAESSRREMELVKRIDAIVELLPRETMREKFSTEEDEAIW
jgi:predicted transcriptional regulator